MNDMACRALSTAPAGDRDTHMLVIDIIAPTMLPATPSITSLPICCPPARLYVDWGRDAVLVVIASSAPVTELDA